MNITAVQLRIWFCMVLELGTGCNNRDVVSSLPMQESTSLMTLAESYISRTVRLSIIGNLRYIIFLLYRFT